MELLKMCNADLQELCKSLERKRVILQNENLMYYHSNLTKNEQISALQKQVDHHKQTTDYTAKQCNEYVITTHRLTKEAQIAKEEFEKSKINLDYWINKYNKLHKEFVDENEKSLHITNAYQLTLSRRSIELQEKNKEVERLNALVDVTKDSSMCKKDSVSCCKRQLAKQEGEMKESPLQIAILIARYREQAKIDAQALYDLDVIASQLDDTNYKLDSMLTEAGKKLLEYKELNDTLVNQIKSISNIINQ